MIAKLFRVSVKQKGYNILLHFSTRTRNFSIKFGESDRDGTSKVIV